MDTLVKTVLGKNIKTMLPAEIKNMLEGVQEELRLIKQFEKGEITADTLAMLAMYRPEDKHELHEAVKTLKAELE